MSAANPAWFYRPGKAIPPSLSPDTKVIKGKYSKVDGLKFAVSRPTPTLARIEIRHCDDDQSATALRQFR
jgi:hypothetical protein